MRVLMVASSLDDDGGEPVAIAQLAAALADLGHSVEVTGQHAHALAPAIESARQHERVRITGSHHPWTLMGQGAAARDVKSLVHQRAREAAAAGERLVVHTHGVWVLPVIAAGSAARKASLQHVVTLHGMLREEAMRKSRWKKWLVLAAGMRRQLASAIVHVSSAAEADDFRRVVPGAMPVNIPLGIVPPTVSGRRTVPRSHRTAGFLGRIIPLKNLDTLLHAWHQAAPADWQLKIVGHASGGYAGELKRLAQGLGLADRVHFQPAIPHDAIGDFFAELDLFILPSKSESFGMSVGESLAAGVPAVTTTATPWVGVTTHGCGWCVEPTTASLARAIREATSCDPAKLAAMGARGAEWMQRDFNWATIAARYVSELYGHDGP